MTHVVCQFSQLTQQFDTKTVFTGLSSTLTDGLTGLVGRNGQGKSVLLALLAQDFPPTSGSIRWLVPFYWVRQLQRLQGLRLADALGVGALSIPADGNEAFLDNTSGSAATLAASRARADMKPVPITPTLWPSWITCALPGMKR